MHAQTVRVLVVEDEEAHAELMRRAFSALGPHTDRFDLTVTGSLNEARDWLARGAQPDLVIADLLLPDGRGTELLSTTDGKPGFPMVVMTSYGNEEVAVEAMKAGALDYVVKSVQALADMPRVAERALREWGHIRQRERAEAALRESEHRLKSILDSVQAGIVIIDAETREIVDANPAALQMVGADRREVVGSICHRFICPTEQHQCPICDLGLNADNSERVLLTSRGEQVPILKNVVVTTLGGRACLIESFVNIAARKRAEEEVRRNATELAAAVARLQELDRLKNEFIQNASHELRTPLALIRGYAEMLLMGAMGGLSPEQHESIAIITRRARMLSDMVQDITIVLEVESSPLEPVAVDLSELAQAVMEDFQMPIEQAKLTLRAEIAPHLPPARGSITHLRRVLDNLLSNAIKFTPAGGRIDLRARQAGEQVVLEVSDTGIGIASDQLDRIFDRFYQIDGSTSRRYGGMGLGLALVKEIVERHRGSVMVTSQLGQGSTFTVTLPIYRYEDGPPHAA